jgi:hypothetical protein
LNGSGSGGVNINFITNSIAKNLMEKNYSSIELISNEKVTISIDKSSKGTISNSFYEIAKSIIFGCQIVVNNVYLYRFVEIEFYLYCSTHQDPYPHKDKKQLEMGQWYFHDSGIDLTFGDGTDHAGILIRSIQKIGAADFINGPWVVRRELLSHITNAANGLLSLKIAPSIALEQNDYPTISTGIRMGLNPNKDTSKQEFFNANYRFVFDAKNPKNRCKKEGLKESITNSVL